MEFVDFVENFKPRSKGEELVFSLCLDNPLCKDPIICLLWIVKFANVLDGVIPNNYKNTCNNILHGLHIARKRNPLLDEHDIAVISSCIYASTKNDTEKIKDFGAFFDGILDELVEKNNVACMSDDQDFNDLEMILMGDD